MAILNDIDYVPDYYCTTSNKLTQQYKYSVFRVASINKYSRYAGLAEILQDELVYCARIDSITILDHKKYMSGVFLIADAEAERLHPYTKSNIIYTFNYHMAEVKRDERNRFIDNLSRTRVLDKYSFLFI